MYVKIDTYGQNSFIVDDEMGVIQLKDNASTNETNEYLITQNVSDRDFINPIDLTTFYADSFDLVYKEETIKENATIEMEVGENAAISLANIVPETTNFGFDSINVNVTSENAAEMSASFNSFSNEISLFSTAVGTYKINVKSTNVEKNFAVLVKEAQPKSIMFSYNTYAPEGYRDSYYSYSYKGLVNGYINVTYFILADINPSSASQEMTFAITGNNASSATLEEKMIKVNEWMDERKAYCFTASKEGSYDVVFTSKVDLNVKNTFHFEISKAPTMSEVLSKDYALKSGSSIKYYVTFTPDVSSVGTTGQMTIENRFNNKKEIASYSIKTSTDGTYYDFTLTHKSEDELGLTFKMSQDFNLFIMDSNSEFSELDIMNSITPEFLASGFYSGKCESYTLDVTLNVDKSASINFYDETYSVYYSLFCAFSLTENGDTYQGSFTANLDTNDPFVSLPLAFTINKEFTSLTLSFSKFDKNFNFNLAKEEYN